MNKNEVKICSKCGRELPRTTEYFHRGNGKDGLKSRCKECRGSKFGVTRKIKRKNVNWSNEDIDFLINNYATMNNKLIAKKINKTPNAIITKAVFLNLKKDIWWSKMEIDLLSKYYPIMITEKFKDKYMPNRSVLSIRKKAKELNISKLNNVLKRIKNNNLKGYNVIGKYNLNWTGTKDLRSTARNRLGAWVQNIKTKYKFRCFVTGQHTDLVVHHIIPFRCIFDETLKIFVSKYNMPIYNNLNEYYKHNKNDILEKFFNTILEKHTEDVGILIHKDIHNKFHEIYGIRYCTKQNFIDFIKNNYNKEVVDSNAK